MTTESPIGIGRATGSSRSTPSLPSDDNDAVNTSSARVYFGPIHSPEKKYTQTTTLKQPTPVRRSARLSAAALVSTFGEELGGRQDRPAAITLDARQTLPPVLDIEENIESEPSRVGTPIIDVFEEPSSALASRVMKAWDNPSPPPTLSCEESAMTIDHNSIGSASRILQSSIEACASGNLATVPDTLARTASPPKNLPISDSTRQSPSIAEQDLITFSTPSAMPTLRILQASPASAVASPARMPATVDDLLSLSPVPAHPAFTVNTVLDGPIEDIGDAIFPAPSPSADEEEQVLQVLSHGRLGSSPPSPGLEETRFSPRDPPRLQAHVAMPSLDPRTLTPVQRSTRSRRSRSPLALSDANSGTSPVPRSSSVTPSDRQGSKLLADAPAVPGLVEGKGRAVLQDQEPGQDFASCVDTLPVEIKETEGQPLVKEKGKRKRSPGFQRELGSLSPTSAGLLMQLLPSPSAPVSEHSSSSESTGQPISVPQFTPSQQSVPSLFSLPQAELHPDIPTSRDSIPSSPQRQPPMSPSKVIDLNRTPARRVPIAQAIVEGTISPHKLPHSKSFGAQGTSIGLLGSPVFRPPVLNDPTRSPAKRIPVIEARFSPDKKGPLPKLNFPVTSGGKEALALKPSSSTTSDSNKHTAGSKLPFAIVSSPTRLPVITPEQDEAQPQPGPSPVPPSSPAKSSPMKPGSSLRQPSSRAESRIPRIGAKPYARPTSTVKSTKSSTAPSPRKVAPAPMPAANSSARPVRIVRKATGKPSGTGSSSDDAGTSGIPGPGPKSTASRAGTGVTSSSVATAATLKRKRDGGGSKASSPPAQSVVIMRKVIPGMFANKGVPPSSASPDKAKSPEPRPTTVQGKVKMRKVATVFPKATTRSPNAGHRAASQQSSDSVSSPAAEEQSDPAQGVTEASPVDIEEHAGTMQTSPDKLVTANVPSPPPEPDPPSQNAATAEPAAQSASGRRVTRSRKSAEPPSDVFGAVAPTIHSKGFKPRRRHATPLESGAFSGMSALALKSLTASNTLKNQKQVVELQTEVVKKEGKRPDSPTTRVRTVLERQREEKSQQRQARAERRARRSGEGSAEMALEDVTEGEDVSELGDLSSMSIERDSNGVALRHRRGPGDEEDYETPVKPERPLKRGRVEDLQEEGEEKRVKWDRGLATTVYLDDSSPKPRKASQTADARKGCLATTAKTIRLDSMGNVLNADIPLADLVQENITVKKFVYEDDETEEAPPPAPVVKSTRSRSKRAKS